VLRRWRSELRLALQDAPIGLFERLIAVQLAALFLLLQMVRLLWQAECIGVTITPRLLLRHNSLPSLRLVGVPWYAAAGSLHFEIAGTRPDLDQIRSLLRPRLDRILGEVVAPFESM
jgi:hypothetical protein